MNTDRKGYIICEAGANISPGMITEEQKVVRFVAEIQEAEVPNRNRRIYSKDAIDNAINHYTIQEKLKTKTLYGESSHPLSDDPRRQMYIDQRNISHIVTSMWWKENKLMANIETADTLAGRDMRGLILQGSQVAFSMRGMSDNIRKDGQYTRVGSPLMIVGWDWVVLPSHPNSYMVKESDNSVMDKEQLVLTEGLLTPYNASELLDHVINTSSNVHQLVEQYGFNINANMGNVTLDKQALSIKEGNETLRIFLEESIKQDLDDFYTSFKL